MKQCVNDDELTRNDTVPHTDSMDLNRGLTRFFLKKGVCPHPTSLSADEVHKRALAARKLYEKAEKALTFWMVEMDERKLYRDFDCSNVFQYATRYLSLGEHTIAEILRTGKALVQLPLLSEAFEKGQISSSHIREISRVATKDTEEYWRDTACGKTVREVEKLVAFTPKGGLPGMKSNQPQPAQSMELTSHSAPVSTTNIAPNCTSAAKTLQEPGTDPGMSRQGEQSNAPVISPQEQNATVEAPHQLQGSVKYHEKLVVDLDAEQMSILQDAFTKARKESGLRDRASLLVHIAKAFLEGCPTSGKRRKPRYQIVLHRHLPSGLAWCDTLKGERPVSPEVLEKAHCDAEIVELDEQPAPTWDRTNRSTVSPTGDQSIEKGHNSSITSVAADRKEADILKEANEYINEQYMSIKAAKRKGRTQYKSIYKSIRQGRESHSRTVEEKDIVA
ncbi:MAG: hypothetical protein AB9903_10010 [Vulcanimicrobiota bacterium]